MLYNPLETTGFFEGTEKVLKLFFACPEPSNGLRSIPRESIESILNCVNAKIVGGSSNKWCDSYVLSESSLFVFDYKMVLKTCGITSLLLALPTIIDVVYQFTECLFEKVLYSRKSYLKPEDQLYPHQDYEQEFKYIRSFFPTCEKIVFGDDDWCLFYYENQSITRNKPKSADCTFEIMMNGLDKKNSSIFLYDKYPSGDLMSEALGIDQLISNSKIDSYAFDPIGYSMNGICQEIYQTIHVTPQYSCSYASYETNLLEPRLLIPVIKNIIHKFAPEEFILTVFNMNCVIDDVKYQDILSQLGYSAEFNQLIQLKSNKLHLIKFNKI